MFPAPHLLSQAPSAPLQGDSSFILTLLQISTSCLHMCSDLPILSSRTFSSPPSTLACLLPELRVWSFPKEGCFSLFLLSLHFSPQPFQAPTVHQGPLQGVSPPSPCSWHTLICCLCSHFLMTKTPGLFFLLLLLHFWLLWDILDLITPSQAQMEIVTCSARRDESGQQSQGARRDLEQDLHSVGAMQL